MKKIVVISIVCAMSLYAAVQTFNNMPSQQLTSAPQEEQKKISTKRISNISVKAARRRGIVPQNKGGKR